jgi:hypothetical protein
LLIFPSSFFQKDSLGKERKEEEEELGKERERVAPKIRLSSFI